LDLFYIYNYILVTSSSLPILLQTYTYMNGHGSAPSLLAAKSKDDFIIVYL